MFRHAKNTLAGRAQKEKLDVIGPKGTRTTKEKGARSYRQAVILANAQLKADPSLYTKLDKLAEVLEAKNHELSKKEQLLGQKKQPMSKSGFATHIKKAKQRGDLFVLGPRRSDSRSGK